MTCLCVIDSMSIEASNDFDREAGRGDVEGASGPERRQITVLFADLADSTSLVEELGEEDYSEVLSTYHAICNETVRGRGGVVAQYLGDGIVCYFGYPHATENDAIRAVTAALQFLDHLESTRLPSANVSIRSRVGIATGPVVFSGTKTHFGEDAVGACLNKASRLQALADEGKVIVCEDTRKLVGSTFEFTAMQGQNLKGFSASESIFMVLGQKAGLSYRFDDLRGRTASRLIGRQAELNTLIERIELARNGEAQRIVVSAEAGMGKSKLISTLRQQGTMQNCRTFMLQCSPEHVNTALYPLKSYFEWIAGVSNTDDADSVHEKLERLFAQVWRADEEKLNLLLDLLSPRNSSQPTEEAASTLLHRRRMFSVLCDMILRSELVSEIVVLIVEDIHWIDPSTAEFIDTLVRMGRGRRIFTLLSTRPEGRYLTDNTPAEDFLVLHALDAQDSEDLARFAASQTQLPAQTVAVILEKSEGVPLFIEEYVDLAAAAAASERSLELDRIPITMNSLIQSKLDDLAAEARQFVQAASALGRVFDMATVKRLTGFDDQQAQHALKVLIERNLAERHDTEMGHQAYRFSHALIRDAVYSSMNRKPRERLHSMIASDLVEGEKSGPIADEIVAHHLFNAGQLSDAGARFLNAAEKSVAAGYAGEALGHLERGLSTLAKMPEGEERDRSELGFRVIQAPTLMVVGGPGNVEFGACLEQIRELMQRLDSDASIVPVVYNAALHNWAIADLALAQRGADELSRIEQRSPDDSAYIASHPIPCKGSLPGIRGAMSSRRQCLRKRCSVTIQAFTVICITCS